MNPIVLSIEGNIGSGKSTMLRTIRETFPEWNIIDEPVDHWMALKDENGKSLLECFYEDKNRWSYTFQNAAFITRYTNIQNALNGVDISLLDHIILVQNQDEYFSFKENSLIR